MLHVRCQKLVGRMDLRFEDPAEEALFKKHLEDQLRRSYACCVLIVGLLLLVSFCTFLYYEATFNVHGIGFAYGAQFVYMIIFASFILLYLTVPIAIWFCRHPRWFRCSGENVLCMIACASCLAAVSQPRRIAMVCNERADDAFSQEYLSLTGDSHDILLILIVVAMLCLFLPIRSCRIWVCSATAILTQIISQSVYPLEQGPRFLDMLAFLWLNLCSLYGAHTIESDIRQKWRAKRVVKDQNTILDSQKELLQSQHKAVCTILTRLCDCLVKTGPQLELLEESAGFSALVFCEARTGVLGRDLRDFVAEGHAHLLETMQLAEEGCCEVLPLRLRGAHGQDVAVHMYYTRFKSDTRPGDGGNCFMIGLTETQDWVNSAMAAMSSDLQKAIHHGAHSQEPDSDSSDASSSRRSASLLQAETMMVTIDIDKDLPIVGYSLEFANHVGAMSERRGLVDIIYEGKTEFIEWLLEAVAACDVPFHRLKLVSGHSSRGRGLRSDVRLKSVRLMPDGRSFQADLGFNTEGPSRSKRHLPDKGGKLSL
eukprot:TRINITY_DN82444_c0_g1_i1.p1 TRINITY_DN82444_c0_g1~~TRINITY_DN82444_c0_g1_i1.p1  ORF type:complete len:540 (+),score=74.65 TRINITY_DN82444_c0_g1_i1:173-1792(+)